MCCYDFYRDRKVCLKNGDNGWVLGFLARGTVVIELETGKVLEMRISDIDRFEKSRDEMIEELRKKSADMLVASYRGRLTDDC